MLKNNQETIDKNKKLIQNELSDLLILTSFIGTEKGLQRTFRILVNQVNGEIKSLSSKLFTNTPLDHKDIVMMTYEKMEDTESGIILEINDQDLQNSFSPLAQEILKKTVEAPLK